MEQRVHDGASEETGYSLLTNLRRQNITTRKQSRIGSRMEIWQIHNRMVQRPSREDVRQDRLRKMVQRCGNGLTVVHISTSVVTNQNGKDVHMTLIDIVEEHGKMSRDDAVHYVEKK